MSAIISIYKGYIRNVFELANELNVNINNISRIELEKSVITQLYDKYGFEFPDYINGQFAIVLEDTENDLVYATRDIYGLQQLFYYITEDNNILFSTSIKDLFNQKGFVKEIDKSVIQLYLSFTYVPGERTFFKGVKKLMPCNYLVFKDKYSSIKRYFTPEFAPDETKTLEEWSSELTDALLSVVKEVRTANEEINTFLSGGIDSSYLAAVGSPKIAYSASYVNSSSDESELAKKTAEYLGLDFKKYEVSPELYFSSLKDFLYDMELPTGDASALVFYLACKDVVKESKICYSGEGSDEWFGGYNIYRKAKQYMSCDQPLYTGNTYIMHTPEQKKVLKYFDESYSIQMFRDNLYSQVDKNESPLSKMLDVDQRVFLEGSIFHNVRRISEATDLEIRTPYVDRRIYNIALHTPDEFKINDDNNKIVLRKSAEKVLPSEVAWRVKKGFPVPIKDWMLIPEYNKVIKESFNSETAKLFFDIDEINNIFNQFITDKPEWWRKVWTIYTFIIWYQVYFE